MSNRGPNLSRRQDLQRAIKRAKPGDLLRLEDLARVWGVVKTRFVNVKNDITMTIGFPEHAPGPNNTHLYPAKASLQKLLDWETRHDKISSDRQKRAARDPRAYAPRSRWRQRDRNPPAARVVGAQSPGGRH